MGPKYEVTHSIRKQLQIPTKLKSLFGSYLFKSKIDFVIFGQNEGVLKIAGLIKQ
jgi:hypothetical protein